MNQGVGFQRWFRGQTERGQVAVSRNQAHRVPLFGSHVTGNQR